MSTELDPQVLIADARKALESGGSADQLDNVHAQIKARINERAGRLKAITAHDRSLFANAPGPERQRIIACGDLPALQALDDECKAIEAELEILRNLQGKLRQRLDETIAGEHVANWPKSCAKLNELLDTLAAANAAQHKARQTVAAQLKELQTQRHHVTRQKALNGQQLELPGADPELLRQYMTVQGYTYHRGQRIGWFSPTGGPHDLKNVAEVLGLDVPRPESETAAAA